MKTSQFAAINRIGFTNSALLNWIAVLVLVVQIVGLTKPAKAELKSAPPTGAVLVQDSVQPSGLAGGATIQHASTKSAQAAIAPVLTALSCATSAMSGSGDFDCSVTLSTPAPAGGMNVALSSDHRSVKVPGYVLVPENSTSGSFTAPVFSVQSKLNVTLTASAGGISTAFSLVLAPSDVPILQISARHIAFGTVPVNTPSIQTLILTSAGKAAVTVSAATLQGTGFTLSGPTFPLTLNPGQTATIGVQFDPLTAGASKGELTVASNSSIKGTEYVHISGTGVASVVLSSVSCSTATISGNGAFACSVNLSAPAPAGGITVYLSTNSTAATVPASVLVAANASTATFAVAASLVTSTLSVTLTAGYGGVSKTFVLQLNPAAVPTLTISATSIAFGSIGINTATTQSLTLSSTGNAPVTVSSAALSGAGFTSSGATFPLTLNSGQTATLAIQFDPATAGALTGQISIVSNSAGSPSAISLTGTGTATLTGLSCASASITGSGTDICTVTLNTPAPAGGFAVNLASNIAAVTTPASITIPARSQTASFFATATSVSTAQTATLTATAGSATTNFAIQLVAATPTLTVSATSVAFGNVIVKTPSTQTLTLTSSGAVAVTVNSAALTGSGFSMSGPTFPLTLNPTQTATLSLEFDPTVAGAATGQLTINSTSSTNGNAVVSLTATGESGSYGVQLTWDAPNSSPDPVAGYNVFRAPEGSTAYQQVNLAVETQTTYLDTAVLGSASYQYIVESVDAEGNESVPSNTFSLTIP